MSVNALLIVLLKRKKGDTFILMLVGKALNIQMPMYKKQKKGYTPPPPPHQSHGIRSSDTLEIKTVSRPNTRPMQRKFKNRA